MAAIKLRSKGKKVFVITSFDVGSEKVDIVILRADSEQKALQKAANYWIKGDGLGPVGAISILEAEIDQGDNVIQIQELN